MKAIALIGFLFVFSTPPAKAQDFSDENKSIPASFDQAIELDNFDQAQLEQALLEVYRTYRKKEGLPTLESSAELGQAARKHSESMREKQFFAHHNPHQKELKSPLMRINAAGLNADEIGENILKQSVLSWPKNKSYRLDEHERPVNMDGELINWLTYHAFAEKAIKSWHRSKGHRKNLQGEFSHVGFGASALSYDTDSKVYLIFITQNFASIP